MLYVTAEEVRERLWRTRGDRVGHELLHALGFASERIAAIDMPSQKLVVLRRI